MALYFWKAYVFTYWLHCPKPWEVCFAVPMSLPWRGREKSSGETHCEQKDAGVSGERAWTDSRRWWWP